MKLTAREMPRSHWRKVAEENDISVNTFNTRIRAGMSPHEAATTPLSHGRPRMPSPPVRRRPSGESLAQKARKAGLKPATAYKRLQKGWPLEKALGTPTLSNSESARRGGKARVAQKRAQREQAGDPS